MQHLHWYFSLHAWCQTQLLQLIVKDIVRIQKPRVWYGAGAMTYLQQHLLLRWQPQQLQRQQCLELMTDGGRSTPVAAAMIACRFEALAVLQPLQGCQAPWQWYLLHIASSMSQLISLVRRVRSIMLLIAMISIPKQTMTRNRHSNRCCMQRLQGYTVLARHQHDLPGRG